MVRAQYCLSGKVAQNRQSECFKNSALHSNRSLYSLLACNPRHVAAVYCSALRHIFHWTLKSPMTIFRLVQEGHYEQCSGSFGHVGRRILASVYTNINGSQLAEMKKYIPYMSPP